MFLNAVHILYQLFVFPREQPSLVRSNFYEVDILSCLTNVLCLESNIHNISVLFLLMDQTYYLYHHHNYFYYLLVLILYILYIDHYDILKFFGELYSRNFVYFCCSSGRVSQLIQHNQHHLCYHPGFYIRDFYNYKFCVHI